MTALFVNREEEIEAFERNLSTLEYSLFLVEGESGIGKTALLAQFEVVLKRSGLPYYLVNFRNSSYTPIEIINGLLRMMGRVNCPALQKVFDALGEVSGIVVKDNQLSLGAKIIIDAQLNLRYEQEREFWYAQLSGALFDDLVNAPQRTYILMMDTYEKASDIVKRWISIHLLPSIRNQRKLIIVVSGQQVPVLDIEWETHYKRLILSGLDLPYWESYARMLSVSPPHPEWIKAWHFLFKGKPAAMIGAIAALG